ncbi:MAG: hypothetical protein AAF497_04020 [Planctomycetota bacterium]
MKNRTRFAVTLLATFLGLASLSSPAMATNHQLRAVEATYRARHHQLASTLKVNEEAIRCEYRDTLRALNAARRDAVRMCEPRRSILLDEIRCARKAAVEKMRCDLKAVRSEHDIACAALKQWRLAARKAARVRLCSTTCDSNVYRTDVYRIDTYTLPHAGLGGGLGPAHTLPPAIQVTPPVTVPAPMAPTPATPPVVLPPSTSGELIFPGTVPATPATELPEFHFGNRSTRNNAETTGAVVDLVAELLSMLARR